MNALDTMRALAQKSEVHTFNTGDIIFKADDPGSSMFGVLEGSVRLSWQNDQGHQGYELIEAGNVFGAGALVMDGHRRLGTAQAEGPCRLIEMNREKFLFAVQEAPMFAIELLASVDSRLRDLKIMSVN
ncbi:MAG: Crp/Fnr family transcriptional regulator [Synechococcus sp.]|uniref:Crp/Fnr family transcriptional regulator n=1 Tax=Synechococcus sp. BMK-MC-1 TaxID=1442551 RepID=UPI001644018C|nr:Crp/Fnr family transcriptional regulator [Synechococcus sp. BMK-MC-1]QNI66856.1 cyclic nucleotide-binding domain containing protein [Synechococcus sp. BMK-MC-1]